MASVPVPRPKKSSSARDVLSRLAAAGGWSKTSHLIPLEISRLTRGNSCTLLVYAINALADPKTGQTPSFSLSEWAELAGCDDREVMRNRDYMKARKMAVCHVTTQRLYSFRLNPESWAALEDYRTWQSKQVEEPTAEDAAKDSAEDPKKVPGAWRMSKPAKVKPGGASRVFTPDVGISGFKIANPGKTPIECFAVVKAGELLITPRFVEPELKKGSVDSKKVNRVADDMHVTRKGGTKGEQNHPRAAEVSAIFDPLLQKSGSRLLSPDSSSLFAACNALADTPRDYLLHFLNAPGGRAERPISGPAAVVKICNECFRNFKCGNTIKKKGSGYDQAKIDAMIAEERAELEKKRAELMRARASRRRSE